jgi:hypothetical protein
MTAPEDVLVLVLHPFSFEDSWVPLTTWMRIGPGPRPLVRPTAAKHARTGALLEIHEAIPLPYRNDDESNRQIAAGSLADPWAHLRADWAKARREM